MSKPHTALTTSQHPLLFLSFLCHPYILTIFLENAQQTNLLPKNASQNDAIFAQKVYRIYATTSQYLSSYGCAITMVYLYILAEAELVSVGLAQVRPN